MKMMQLGLVLVVSGAALGTLRIANTAEAQSNDLTICHYPRHALPESDGQDNLSDFVLNQFGNPGRDFCELNGGHVITVPREAAIRAHGIFS